VAKQVPSAARRQPPALNAVLGIRPQQVAHCAVVGHLRLNGCVCVRGRLGGGGGGGGQRLRPGPAEFPGPRRPGQSAATPAERPGPPHPQRPTLPCPAPSPDPSSLPCAAPCPALRCPAPGSSSLARAPPASCL
jgi:hypothetical protein